MIFVNIKHIDRHRYQNPTPPDTKKKKYMAGSRLSNDNGHSKQECLPALCRTCKLY